MAGAGADAAVARGASGQRRGQHADGGAVVTGSGSPGLVPPALNEKLVDDEGRRVREMAGQGSPVVV